MPIYDLQIWFLLEIARRVARISFSPDCKKREKCYREKMSQKRALIIVLNPLFCLNIYIKRTAIQETQESSLHYNTKHCMQKSEKPQNSTQLLLKVGSSQFLRGRGVEAGWCTLLFRFCLNCPILTLVSFQVSSFPFTFFFVFTPNKNSSLS